MLKKKNSVVSVSFRIEYHFHIEYRDTKFWHCDITRGGYYVPATDKHTDSKEDFVLNSHAWLKNKQDKLKMFMSKCHG